MVEEKTLYAFLFPKTVPPISLNAIQQCRAPYDAPGTTTYRDFSSGRAPKTPLHKAGIPRCRAPTALSPYL